VRLRSCSEVKILATTTPSAFMLNKWGKCKRSPSSRLSVRDKKLASLFSNRTRLWICFQSALYRSISLAAESWTRS
jgi:hypothetical protein